MKLGSSYDHTHTWDRGDKRTSRDDEHDHGVSNPDSGWTDGGGMEDHKHRIPKKAKLVKKKQRIRLVVDHGPHKATALVRFQYPLPRK